MGKLTISIGPFSIAVLVYQRVHEIGHERLNHVESRDGLLDGNHQLPLVTSPLQLDYIEAMKSTAQACGRNGFPQQVD
jgi:hypothetical protein